MHVKRPRQCLPYAVITFSLGDVSTAFQELSITQVSSFGHLRVSSVSWYSEFLIFHLNYLYEVIKKASGNDSIKAQ